MSVFHRIARLLASFRTRYFTITSLVALGIGSGLGLLVYFRPDLIPSEPPVALDLFVDYWVAAVKVVVTPLIVAYLIVAIVSIGTAGETGKLGGITLLVHTALALGGLALALLASKYFIPLSDSNVEQLRPILNQIAVPDNPGAGPYRASFWDTAIAQVWANPVTAIREGRIVPLLLWTLGLAFVLRSLRTSLRTRIVGFFETVVDLGQLVVAALLLFMPVVVCGFLFTLVARLGLEVLGAVAFYIVGVSAVTALYTIVLYLLMPIAAGIRVRDFAKSLVPSQLVAIGSRSSLACMPTLIEAGETKLRLSRPVVEFVLPLSISTMKVSRTVANPFKFFFLIHLFGLHIDPAVATGLIAAEFALSYGSPGVPTGSIIVTLPLYVAAGIPVEGYALLLAVDAIPDMFKTILNATEGLALACIVHRITGGLAAESQPAVVAVE